MGSENAHGISVRGIDQHIGRRLRERRSFLQISQETLAQGLNLKLEDLRAYESGLARVDAATLLQLAQALQVPTRHFLIGYGEGVTGGLLGGQGWLREVDRWFCAQVSPHETLFLARARRMMGDPESARDLVHDAYAKIITGDTWRSISHPRAYVLRIIYHLGLNRLRDARVVPMQQLAVAETLLHADSAPDAFQTLAGRQAFHRLLNALEALPTQCRRVVVLRRIHEMPPRDIAQG